VKLIKMATLIMQHQLVLVLCYVKVGNCSTRQNLYYRSLERNNKFFSPTARQVWLGHTLW